MSWRVLIVEDNLIIRMYFQRILENLGNQVVGVTDNGREAIELTANLKPDIVFMDIGLEGDMDGIETSEKIDPDLYKAMVFLTGNSDAATLERARAANPLHMIIKPIDKNKLSEEMELLSSKIDH